MYYVDIGNANAAFPSKAEDYNYASEEDVTRAFGESVGLRLVDLRAETQRRLDRAIGPDRGRSPDDSGSIPAGLDGAISGKGRLRLTHYSPAPIERTDPTRVGTGADRNARRDTRVPYTWFGITDADLNPYVLEPAVADDTENRFFVDPNKVYPLDSNPEGLKVIDGGRFDIGSTIKALSDAGYIGFWTDNSRIGKIAVIGEPLDVASRKDVDDDVMNRFIAGATSPGTKLSPNIRDAVQSFDLFMRDGSFSAFDMGVSEKGNPVILSAPFDLSGITSPTKARYFKAFDSIVKDQGGIKQAIDYLFEPVPMSELEAWKKSLGYAGVKDKGQIKGLTQDATGQDKLIPRMFFLGPKVGAYTLNTMGDGRYQTVDVWEARFIRSYFDNMFDVNTGITVTADEGALFRDFSKVFAEEFEKSAGYRPDLSTLQAMRWFYMINAARQAGYRSASTNETISELTEQKLQQTRATRYGGRRQGAQAIQANATALPRQPAGAVQAQGLVDDDIVYSRGSNITFEVAPDPANTEMVERCGPKCANREYEK